MSGGVIYDLWAFAFAAVCASIAALVYALRAKHHRPKVHDWAKEWPEYACAKDAHVKVVP